MTVHMIFTNQDIMQTRQMLVGETNQLALLELLIFSAGIRHAGVGVGIGGCMVKPNGTLDITLDCQPEHEELVIEAIRIDLQRFELFHHSDYIILTDDENGHGRKEWGI